MTPKPADIPVPTFKSHPLPVRPSSPRALNVTCPSLGDPSRPLLSSQAGSLSVTGAGRAPGSPPDPPCQPRLHPVQRLTSKAHACVHIQAAPASPQCSPSWHNLSVTPSVPGLCCARGGFCSPQEAVFSGPAGGDPPPEAPLLLLSLHQPPFTGSPCLSAQVSGVSKAVGKHCLADVRQTPC